MSFSCTFSFFILLPLYMMKNSDEISNVQINTVSPKCHEIWVQTTNTSLILDVEIIWMPSKYCYMFLPSVYFK